MPIYTTAANIRMTVARDPRDDRGTAASLEDAEIEAQIDNAEAEINSVLTHRYVVPFQAPAPALVKTITEAIAAYLATLTYRQGRDLQPTDPVALREKWARAMLVKLADGNADLEVEGTVTERGGTVGKPINRLDGRMFGLGDFGLSDRRRGRGWC